MVPLLISAIQLPDKKDESLRKLQRVCYYLLQVAFSSGTSGTPRPIGSLSGAHTAVNFFKSLCWVFISSYFVSWTYFSSALMAFPSALSLELLDLILLFFFFLLHVFPLFLLLSFLLLLTSSSFSDFSSYSSS
jgi:hypothetical protein